MSWDTFYDPHPPTLYAQFPRSDVLELILTNQGKWIGMGFHAGTHTDVHMNGRFVSLTRITSTKS